MNLADALIQAAAVGVIGGITAGAVARGIIKTEIKYLRRDVDALLRAVFPGRFVRNPKE